MPDQYCPRCGSPCEAGAAFCSKCGSALNRDPQSQQTYQEPPYQQQYQQYQQPYQQTNYYVNNYHIDPCWPYKSKIAAGLLGIFLGGLGIHKFYLGQTGMGILYLVLCCTGIPAIIGFIEGIVYLCTDDHTFQMKYRCRLQ